MRQLTVIINFYSNAVSRKQFTRHGVFLGFRCRAAGYWLLGTGSWPEARSEKLAAKTLTPDT